MSINPSDPHVRYTQIVSFDGSKEKQSDDLFLQDRVDGWFLSYNVNEFGKVLVKARKALGSSKYNDESKIEFTIETKEKRTPRIKKINTEPKSNFDDPNYVEIDDNKDRTTGLFKGHFSKQWVASSILTPQEFLQEVIPNVDKLLKDKQFNEYVSEVEAAIK